VYLQAHKQTGWTMSGILMVFVGGGTGAVLRYGTSLAALRWLGPGVPLGTLAVNVVGSFLMGIFWAIFSANLEHALSLHARLLLATGFLGGFTTFSAFSLEAVSLWERGATGAAIAYLVGSVVLSVAALAAGLAITRAVAA
jgi:CrcB protein